VGVVLLDAVVVLVGFGFLYAVGLARPRLADVRLAGLAFLVGWALLGVALSFALVVGVDPSIGHVLVVAALLCIVCTCAGRGRVAPLELIVARPRRIGAAVVVSAATVVLAIAAVSALVVAFKGQWGVEEDAWNFWIPRAETIYYFHGLDTGVGGWGTIRH